MSENGTNGCENGNHEKVVRDRFMQLPGVTRKVPGDCFCIECNQALPYWWNNGHPKPVPEEASQ